MTQAIQGDVVQKDAPLPTFDALPLGSDVRKAIDALGYLNPTPVQLAVFEPAARGRNLVVQARTGTGKTAAFGLPIVDSLVRKSQPGVQALILTPTRELALQVAAELEHLAKFRGTKILAVYGGAPMGRQIAALEDGAQIVCGTPGRVLDHIRRGTLDTTNIRIFVLDEADEMLSMGFAKELNAIIENLPKDRQGLYFSATIPPDVERLANNHLRDPEYVTLSSDQVGALEISHFVYLVREGDKRAALARILEVEDPESAIVFCNTRDETERLAELLKNRGYDAEHLNGDLDQREREKVMSMVREGKLRFLVATDVAARGIDISHLTHVINADFPESAEQYVHRTGRTGRAGKTGTAISVVGPKDVGHLYMLRLTYKIRPIERMLPTSGELRTRAETDIVAFLAEAYAGKTADPLHLAVARRLVTHEDAESVIAGLLADHLGARDATQESADARRAKNPPPEAKPERPQAEVGPHTLRDGERPRERSRERDSRERDRGERDRDRGPAREQDRPLPRVQVAPERAPSPPSGGTPERSQPRERQERGRNNHRQPHSALSDWEPPADADDDAPLFSEPSEKGTEPGLGPATPAVESADRGRDRRGRRDHNRDRERRPRVDAEAPELPRFTVAGESEPETPRRRERDEDDPAFANIFINVGRRDGLRPADVQQLLVERAGIGDADVGHIRLRDRMTFVGVKRELAERVIKALVGQIVGDRTINAEPARENR